MVDDRTKPGDSDDERININNDYEVRDWSKKLGVTHQELLEAVQAVGDRLEDVERHLKRSRA